MSVTIVSFIATDHEFVPPAELRERAVDLAQKRCPRAREITFRVEAGLQFVDCGESFEHVRCPACGADLLSAWQDATEAAFDGVAFGGLTWTTPCCATVTSLNALDYRDTMGFARAWLEIEDPSDEPPEGLRSELEALLGCQLRVVHAHY